MTNDATRATAESLPRPVDELTLSIEAENLYRVLKVAFTAVVESGNKFNDPSEEYYEEAVALTFVARDLAKKLIEQIEAHTRHLWVVRKRAEAGGVDTCCASSPAS